MTAPLIDPDEPRFQLGLEETDRTHLEFIDLVNRLRGPGQHRRVIRAGQIHVLHPDDVDAIEPPQDAGNDVCV